MSDDVSPPSGNGPGGGRFPLSRRTLGILVMVAGAAAFAYSRVVLGDQMLCFLGSTLIVFAGLAIILAARRSGAGSRIGQAGGQQDAGLGDMSGEPRPVFRRRIPRGLREEARKRNITQPPAASPEPGRPAPPVVGLTGAQDEVKSGAQGTLLGEVISILNRQGAQVAIETQREDAGGSRGILQVQSADGLPYSLLVLESDEPVDVADVRALYALVTSSGSAGGYLVASAPFTQRAYEWAGARHIHLVRDDELDEMSI